MKKITLSKMINNFILIIVVVIMLVQGVMLACIGYMSKKYNQNAISTYADKVCKALNDESEKVSDYAEAISRSDFLVHFLNKEDTEEIYRYLDNIRIGTNQFIYAFFMDSNDEITRISNDISNSDYNFLTNSKELYNTNKTMLVLDNEYKEVFLMAHSEVVRYDFDRLTFVTLGNIYVCSKISIPKIMMRIEDSNVEISSFEIDEMPESLSKYQKVTGYNELNKTVLNHNLYFAGKICEENSTFLMIITIVVIETILLIAIIAMLRKKMHKYVRKPIDDLITQLDHYNLFKEKKYDEIKGAEEIVRINKHIMSLISNVKDRTRALVKNQQDLYEMEILNNQYKYAMLQNQINPHFFYNTLNCIHGIALCNGVTIISEICEYMSDILAYSMNNDEKYVCLGEEIDVIKKYLKIMKIRFESDFQVIINVPENLNDYKIIRMSLQPIVENSFSHGKFQRKKQAGRMIISAFERDGKLSVIVTDNGVGIEGKRLEELNNQLKDNKTPMKMRGLGVCNINSRLISEYGVGYGVRIYSKESKCTAVKILFETRGS